jgi:hypothetical protein
MSKRRKSSVWNYFTITKENIKCNDCESIFSLRVSTTNLKKHHTSEHLTEINLEKKKKNEKFNFRRKSKYNK